MNRGKLGTSPCTYISNTFSARYESACWRVLGWVLPGLYHAYAFSKLIFKPPSLSQSLSLFLHFQDAYAFWICSYYLPLYLTPSGSRGGGGGGGGDQQPVTSNSGGDQEEEEEREAVQVEMCPSVCREVERKCPFFILGHEDDKAAGNPSFICKGRTQQGLINTFSSDLLLVKFGTCLVHRYVSGCYLDWTGNSAARRQKHLQSK